MGDLHEDAELDNAVRALVLDGSLLLVPLPGGGHALTFPGEAVAADTIELHNGAGVLVNRVDGWRTGDDFDDCRVTYHLGCGCRIEAPPHPAYKRHKLGTATVCGTHGYRRFTSVTFHAPDRGGDAAGDPTTV